MGYESIFYEIWGISRLRTREKLCK